MSPVQLVFISQFPTSGQSAGVLSIQPFLSCVGEPSTHVASPGHLTTLSSSHIPLNRLRRLPPTVLLHPPVTTPSLIPTLPPSYSSSGPSQHRHSRQVPVTESPCAREGFVLTTKRAAASPSWSTAHLAHTCPNASSLVLKTLTPTLPSSNPRCSRTDRCVPPVLKARGPVYHCLSLRRLH